MKLAVIVAGFYQEGHYCGKCLGNPKAIRERVDNYVRPSTQVDYIFADYGPETIESRYDSTIAAAAALEKAEWAAKQGYDGLTVSCMGDPGVDAMKEALDIPVVGPGEAARAVATILGDKVARVSHPGMTIIEAAADREKAYKVVMGEAKKALADGTQTLILGCCGLQGFGPRMQKELGVPVLEGEGLALAMAQLFVDVGLMQSRVRFRKPSPTKKRKLRGEE